MGAMGGRSIVSIVDDSYYILLLLLSLHDEKDITKNHDYNILRLEADKCLTFDNSHAWRGMVEMIG